MLWVCSAYRAAASTNNRWDLCLNQFSTATASPPPSPFLSMRSGWALGQHPPSLLFWMLLLPLLLLSLVRMVLHGIAYRTSLAAFVFGGLS